MSSWQIRLLVKIHRFLQSRNLEADLLESDRPLNEIRDSYLECLRIYITRALIWLLKVNVTSGELLLPLDAERQRDLEQGSVRKERLRHCQQPRDSIRFDRSYSQACFITLTVWYVMKHCEEAITDYLKSLFVSDQLDKMYTSVDRTSTGGEDEPSPKNDVLRWLHFSCLLLICQQPFIQGSDESDLDSHAGLLRRRQAIERSQEKCEKTVTRLRKTNVEAYSVEDEEVDRLFLIGSELRFDSLRTSTSNLIESRTKRTRAKISDRKPTIKVNPGLLDQNTGTVSRTISNGPWELNCLNHHSLLRIAFDEASARARRDTCLEFVLSDYTFMTSWDRADSCMLDKWWNFETGSVISATLLDLKNEGSPHLLLPR